MEMEIKENAEATATSDFWYDLFEGGYLSPSKFLKNEDDVKKIEDARQLLMSYKRALMDSELVEDM